MQYTSCSCSFFDSTRNVNTPLAKTPLAVQNASLRERFPFEGVREVPREPHTRVEASGKCLERKGELGTNFEIFLFPPGYCSKSQNVKIVTNGPNVLPKRAKYYSLVRTLDY